MKKIMFLFLLVLLNSCFQSNDTTLSPNKYGISLKRLATGPESVDSILVSLIQTSVEIPSEVEIDIEDSLAWISFEAAEGERLLLNYLIYVDGLVQGSGKDTLFAGEKGNAAAPFIVKFERLDSAISLVDSIHYKVSWGSTTPANMELYPFGDDYKIASSNGEIKFAYSDMGETLEQVIFLTASSANGLSVVFKDTIRLENQAPELSISCTNKPVGEWDLEGEISDPDNNVPSGSSDYFIRWFIDTNRDTIKNNQTNLFENFALDTITASVQDIYGAADTVRFAWRDICIEEINNAKTLDLKD